VRRQERLDLVEDSSLDSEGSDVRKIEIEDQKSWPWKYNSPCGTILPPIDTGCRDIEIADPNVFPLHLDSAYSITPLSPTADMDVDVDLPVSLSPTDPLDGDVDFFRAMSEHGNPAK
jgi:hypothetical protein